MTDPTPLSPAAQAVLVTERLPEPNTKVLAHYFNDLGKGRTICAIWVPAKSRSDQSGGDDFTEYDEEDDKFYWPEGWYEVIENWEELGWVQVYEGEVDYWQPLPKWPARRPTPPSLKKQALESVKRFESSGDFFSDQMRELEFIRKALEQLDD